ncbi:MAG: phosphoribosylglycinamide formyltransferase [Bacteroidetes bacterium]|nr:phosphoribosylglycinamide formyltransferase [Bacteroidota bacterium]
MKKIVIFASGSGTNAQRIAEFFKSGDQISLVRIYCNRTDAFVLKRAENLGIPVLIFNKNDFYNSDAVLNQLYADKPDLIVLAGFLWLVPVKIIQAYENKIVNIHPALLPKFGGKGMYGSYVHESVINSGEAESGISIHFVNEKYDEGSIIFQAKCKVDESDTPETLASKIHTLEYEHYPHIIAQILNASSNDRN